MKALSSSRPDFGRRIVSLLPFTSDAFRRSEQRRVEKALQSAYSYNRSLIEASLDPLLTIDPAGRISDVNAATERTTGHSRETLIGTDFSHYFTDPERARAGYARVFADGLVRGYRLEIRHRDGHLTPVLYNASVYRDGAGNVLGVFAAARDITEQLKLEEQLRQAQKMEAIGTLAGGVAHDFNNLLAIMIGFTEMLLDDVSEIPDAQHKMEQILKAGLRGRDLVKQILAFSRKTESARKEISLTSVVKETHALLRSSLPTTIEMRLILETSDDYVLADATEIQQVLMNLATNAADAMRENGGFLTMKLSTVEFSPDSMLPDADMAPRTYVKLSVTDTGTGMTEAARHRIFEPFFTTKERGKGTGMGLAVAYGIVKNHGGAITAQSEGGNGSTFEVYLPRIEKSESHGPENVTALFPRGNERILFVDDEELLVEMAKAMLESLGYHVTPSLHPAEALNLFRKAPSEFDLIITDQTMPEMTGIALAKQMLELRKDLPIILCTGHSETASPEKAQEVGISAFAMKPLMKKELAETVRQVLDGSKPEV